MGALTALHIAIVM